jgi:hypothetical protein
MHNPDVIPPSVAGCLAEIERSVQRFRSCYSLGTDPERLLTDEIITMRVELIRLWSEISAVKNTQAGDWRASQTCPPTLRSSKKVPAQNSESH